ncbi:MAG: DUF4189 domain-containing protein [Paracoccaceae bacterium]
MMRAALIAAAPLVLATSLPAAADWGGVAVNSDGVGWGYSAGWNSRREARDRAMFYCHQYSEDNAGCKVVMTTTACGAVARGRVSGKPKLFVADARSRDAAETGALAQCREAGAASCELRRKFCANDL